MERVNITIGPLSFDHADYDADNDVLYLHVGAPQAAEGEETPEGHVVRYAPGTSRIVGLTVLGARGVWSATGALRSRSPRPWRQPRSNWLPRSRLSSYLSRQTQ